jgi:Putative zinc ribbon domain
MNFHALVTVLGGWCVQVWLTSDSDLFLWASVMSLAIQCESCGRPLASREEHGAQDLDNPYCIHCTDMKGKLLPFEKLYDDMVGSAMQTRWMNKEQAEKYALEEMGRWPAWKDRVDKLLKR